MSTNEFPKFIKEWHSQWICSDISLLFCSQYILHGDVTATNMFSEVMQFRVDVIGARTEFGQSEELTGAGVVTE
jgi:hypothetical protein